jgi:tetratricopeptide (TPR) repeat protein
MSVAGSRGETWLPSIVSASLIVLVTVLVYVPVMRGGFIWDDDNYIADNQMIKASDGLYRFWFTAEAADYWPLTGSVEWVEWRLWGNQPAGYHLTNILLHAFNAVLVWITLRRLEIPGAWLAGLVFGIHPVNVDTAAWVSEQNNTISMLFYLTAIILYLRFDEGGRWRWYGCSLASFLLALLSKTTVVMLPVVLLGCVWWLHGKVVRKQLLCSAPFFGLSLTAGLVTIWLQSPRVLEGQAILKGGFLSRLAAACQAPWFYWYKALLPCRLSAVYPQWNVDWSQGFSYLMGIVLAGLLILFWRNRRSWGRPLLFGVSYFVVVLFPVLGFFKQTFHRYSLVADHWQYVAIAAPISLVIAAGVVVCSRHGERGKFVGVFASLIALFVLGVATWTRAGVYENSESLWRDTVEKNPSAWVAHYNLGTALLRENKLQDAIKHYKRALEIKPDYLEGRNNLAVILFQAGKIDDAVAHLKEAARISPNSAEIQQNLGSALLMAGRPNDAIVHLEQVVRINPDSAAGHYNLGNAFFQAGKGQDAIGQYEQAVRLSPDYVQAHVNLGFALAQRGRLDEAVQHWKIALRLDPSNQDAERGLERVQKNGLSTSRAP